MTRREIRNAVRRGVAVLNKTRPSWVTKINTQRLDLSRCDLCVLGQLYSTPGDEDGYERGLELLNGAVQENPGMYGFSVDELSGEDYWDVLDEIWRDEIAKQRAARRRKKAAA